MKVSLKTGLLVRMGIDDTRISKPNYVDLVILIRSIQRAEGNIDCYRRGRRQCDRKDCAWRDHCLKEAEGSSKVDTEAHKRKKAASPRPEQDSFHK